MTADYAPDAIRGVFDQVVKLAPDLKVKLGGILGDAAHYADGGYHVPRASIRGWDYSVDVMPDDQLGDPHAAAALDLTPADLHGQALITSRLLAAVANRDPRLKPVREFFGSLNGTSVVGRDVPTRRPVTADSSHTWHVHISILRRYANDAAALAGIAPVIAGIPFDEGLDMTPEEVRKIVHDEVRAAVADGVVVDALLDYAHKGNHSIEAFLTGIPGYQTVAAREAAKTAAKKTTAKAKPS